MRKTTKKRRDQMFELSVLVKSWITDIDSLGNETAYSDDIIEHIYSKIKDIRSSIYTELGMSEPVDEK